jgi:hypothetical protein
MQAGLYSAGKGASNNSFPRRQVSVTILCYPATAGCFMRLVVWFPGREVMQRCDPYCGLVVRAVSF